MTRDKVLITGGKGMLGSAMTRAFGRRAVPLSRDELDIANAGAFREACLGHGAAAVVNAAGVNSGARRDLFAVNAFFPGELAKVCAELGIPFVFFSSSRVFGRNGDAPWLEDDSGWPVDDYGLSKFAGERIVEQEMHGCPYYTVRLPMVLGQPRRPENQILTRLVIEGRRFGIVHVARDVFHSPLGLEKAALGVKALLDEARESGIYHVTSSGSGSLYEIVKLFMAEAGLDIQVVPVAAAWFGKPRVAYNLALGSRKLEPQAGWQDAVAGFARSFRGQREGGGW